MDEFEFIDIIAEKLGSIESIENDGFSFKEENLVITKDVLCEGVHFFSGITGYDLALKSMGVNLSDIASMGAKPYGYFVGLSLNKDLYRDKKWMESLISGFQDINNQYEISVLGGDTTSSKNGIFISITMLGRKNNENVLTRKGANVGDDVYVTGSIGDAAMGLYVYENDIDEFTFLKERYNYPNPRISVGKNISNIANSCIDISDGLIQDAEHICKWSKVGIIINKEDIPISEEGMIFLNEYKKDDLLFKGDDYELFFTVAKGMDNEIKSIEDRCGVKISKIGEVIEGDGVKLYSGGEMIRSDIKGYNHLG